MLLATPDALARWFRARVRDRDHALDDEALALVCALAELAGGVRATDNGGARAPLPAGARAVVGCAHGCAARSAENMLVIFLI